MKLSGKPRQVRNGHSRGATKRTAALLALAAGLALAATIIAVDGIEEEASAAGTTIVVTGASDDINGDTSSAQALAANPGMDGVSFGEAIEVANNDPGAYSIGFAAGLKGKTITLRRIPVLAGGGVSIEGDIDGDGGPDVRLGNGQQTRWSRGIQISSSGNRLHGLILQGFATGVAIDADATQGDVLPTHRTLADNVISNLRIRDSRVNSVALVSSASTACGLPDPDPCRTYNAFQDTTIADNTVVRSGGIGLSLGNSGDRIERATITGNDIQLQKAGYLGGITVEQGGDPGTDGVPAPISEVLIANNTIEGKGRGMEGIAVAAGVGRAQGNTTEGVRVRGNRVKLVRPGRRDCVACQGIVLRAGSDTAEATEPGLRPRLTPDRNLLRDVKVTGNRVSGELDFGVFVQAGGGGAAGSRNRVREVTVERNVITSRDVAKAVALETGGAHYGRRWATGNLITDLTLRSNTIENGSGHRPRGKLAEQAGVLLKGGDDRSRRGLIRDVVIKRNRIKNRLKAVRAGIKLIGGRGRTAKNNRVACVRLAGNRVKGTPRAVSVRSNLEGSTNRASRGGC
ncbi:MAG: right-handed parallel beta-helix repeat-containing protein [Solirubrobacterales bacterium]|nr:right-handed parallel beta-helix repeat-containing protein [Solirubrobacterales bacterium]